MDITAAATLFAWLDREIWLLTARVGGRQGGLIATYVNPSSLVPDSPRVLVTLAKHHHTAELVEQGGLFALHLLAEANVGLVWRFGLHSGRDRDKFAGLAVSTSEAGCPVLDETVGWIECRVEERLDAGDRTVYLAEVLQGRVTHFAPPLGVRRMLELAPPHLLAELQRQRHHDSHVDAEAIRLSREGRAAVGG